MNAWRSSGMRTLTNWLTRRSQHRVNRRAGAGLRHPSHLEAVTFVERDVARVRGLEVGGQMIVIDEPEAVAHQLAPEAPALLCLLNAEPWQIPVRERRMSSVHLLEYC